jgi:hypothetical protein
MSVKPVDDRSPSGDVPPGARTVALVIGILLVANALQASLSTRPLTSSASPVQPPEALSSAAPPATLKESTL